MPQPKHNPHLLELAKRGAQAQLNDLMHEVTMLFDLFPHLRDSLDRDELPLLFLLKQGSEKALRKRTAGSAKESKAANRALSAARKKAPKKA